MSVQEIFIETTDRVETGAVKFAWLHGGSDWPGLFVRGDDCIALAFASDGAVVFASPTGKTGIIKSYGLVWKSGARRAFATLPHDKSLVYL